MLYNEILLNEIRKTSGKFDISKKNLKIIKKENILNLPKKKKSWKKGNIILGMILLICFKSTHVLNYNFENVPYSSCAIILY